MKSLNKSYLATILMSAVMGEANPQDGSQAGDSAVAQSAASFANGPTSASGRIKVADKDYDEETGTFSIVFANGRQAEVNLDSLPQNIVRLLALHGLSQKLGDSYASVKGDVEEAMKRFDAVATQLANGEWKKAREGSGEGAGKVTELAAAIARFRNAPIEKANAAVAKATPEQKKAWQGHPQLKAIIAQIRAEKAAEKAAKAQAAAGTEGQETPEADLDSIDLG